MTLWSASELAYSPVKPAVTERALFMATVQVDPLTVSHPVHPVNSEPSPGLAVSVTVEPITYGSVQSAPHEMPPGCDVTVPLPMSVRLMVTFKVKRCRSNLAASVRGALIVSVHVGPDGESQATHPMKLERLSADAVRLTCESLMNVDVHVAGQLMPAGVEVTVPPPSPVRARSSASMARTTTVTLP